MSDDNIDYKQFGKTIRKLRGKRTQSAVSEALNISPAYYSNIENGLAHPGLHILVSIANYYGISLASAFCEEEYNYDIPDDVREAFKTCTDEEFLDVLEVLKYVREKLMKDNKDSKDSTDRKKHKPY